jgi:GNAT superfamily N-acetyltransferase
MRTWYLEQTSPSAIRVGGTPVEPVDVVRAEIVSPELSRFLYTAVGGDWHWVDRLPWTWRQWRDWLDRPGVETWVAWVRGTPAGYAELESQGGAVEITHFGLLPTFHGRRIGGRLLADALSAAWTLADRWPGVPPTGRVWLHTCSLDGPAALANYEARGLTVFRVEESDASAPGESPGPWPGAERPPAL